MNIDNEYKIAYRPYGDYVFVTLCLIVTGIDRIIVICTTQNTDVIGVSVIILLVILGFLKYSFDVIKVLILFYEDGIRVKNDFRVKDYYVPWTNLKYGYYVGSDVKDTALVLSPYEMNSRELRKIAKTCELKGMACMKEIVIIQVEVYLSSNGAGAQIRAFVEKKVPNIKYI